MLDPRLPLIKADGEINSNELLNYKAHGFHAINYQVQNDYKLIDYDLNPAKTAGLVTGVWGVSYRQDEFYRDGVNLARQAVKLGAQHLTTDIEFALKDTRGSSLVRDTMIKGIRDGGWTGPVHLNTLGGPQNPKTATNPNGNDYGYDYQAFLDTGGSVYLQCYYNMADEYHPKQSLDHAALYVPRDRLNATISLAYSEPWAPKPVFRISGAEWVLILREAGVTKNLSIFLARSIMPGDLSGLDALTLAPDPDPIKELMEKLKLNNTGINAVLDRLEGVFDQLNIAEPDGIDALRNHLLATGHKINEVIDHLNAQE